VPRFWKIIQIIIRRITDKEEILRSAVKFNDFTPSAASSPQRECGVIFGPHPYNYKAAGIVTVSAFQEK
jgi:hypothetical protein